MANAMHLSQTYSTSNSESLLQRRHLSSYTHTTSWRSNMLYEGCTCLYTCGHNEAPRWPRQARWNCPKSLIFTSLPLHCSTVPGRWSDAETEEKAQGLSRPPCAISELRHNIMLPQQGHTIFCQLICHRPAGTSDAACKELLKSLAYSLISMRGRPKMKWRGQPLTWGIPGFTALAILRYKPSR